MQVSHAAFSLQPVALRFEIAIANVCSALLFGRIPSILSFAYMARHGMYWFVVVVHVVSHGWRLGIVLYKSPGLPEP